MRPRPAKAVERRRQLEADERRDAEEVARLRLQERRESRAHTKGRDSEGVVSAASVSVATERGAGPRFCGNERGAGPRGCGLQRCAHATV